MSAWQDEQLHALLSIRGERKLLDAIATIARDLEFEHYSYGLRIPVPITRPLVKIFSNYPLLWHEQYRERDYVKVDPTVRHGMQSLLPVVWSDDLFASAHELWEEARSFGLHVGWAQSSRDVNGVSGLLTLARSRERLSDVELDEKSLKMSWLAQVAHLGMSRCLTA